MNIQKIINNLVDDGWTAADAVSAAKIIQRYEEPLPLEWFIRRVVNSLQKRRVAA